MKRLRLGAAILILCLSLSLGAVMMLGRAAEETAALLEGAKAAAGTEGSAEQLREAEARWERSRWLCALILHGGKQDELAALFGEAEELGRRGLWDDFAVCCGRLTAALRAAAEGERPGWGSVF